jgi:hypothetical protein
MITGVQFEQELYTESRQGKMRRIQYGCSKEKQGVYMSDEVEKKLIEESNAEPFVPSEALQAAIDEAMLKIAQRAWEERYSKLGKMKKCQVHGFRHREFEFNNKGCEQVFTYHVKDEKGEYAQYREDEKGEMVPDYRTAVRPDEKATKEQLMGAATYAKKRFHPHYSKIKLLFIERTREVYDKLKFVHNLLGTPPATASRLQRARVIAARQIRKEREVRERAARRRADQSRRINRGLKLGRNRA